MSEDFVTPPEEPIEPEEVRPIDPDGLKLSNYYRSPLEGAPPAGKVSVPEAKNIIDDSVSTPAILWTGLKQLMTTVIILTKARSIMAQATAIETPQTVTVETKRWYESKTLWLNGLTFIWYFVGPMVGIPILTPEVTGIALTAANLLLRAVTKSPVTIQ